MRLAQSIREFINRPNRRGNEMSIPGVVTWGAEPTEFAWTTNMGELGQQQAVTTINPGVMQDASIRDMQNAQHRYRIDNFEVPNRVEQPPTPRVEPLSFEEEWEAQTLKEHEILDKYKRDKKDEEPISTDCMFIH